MRCVMNVIPSIDLYEGQVVRLKQGDFNNKTIYTIDPEALMSQYDNSQFSDIHVVNLSGAKDAEKMSDELLEKLLVKRNIKIQYGGGVRNFNDVEYLFSKGIDRVVIGSLTAKEPSLIKDWIRQFGIDRVVLAIDVKIKNGIPIVMIQGWKEETNISLYSLMKYFIENKNLRVLCTDISCDGLMNGPNILLYELLADKYPNIKWLASGGVRNIEDLKNLYDVGICDVVVGKSLYEKSLTINECKEVRKWSRNE